MAMSTTTRKYLDKAHEIFGDREFTEYEWEDAVPQLTLRTACRYEVEVIHHTTRQYYTVRELVDMLNSYAGDDLYECDWHYEIDEQGRVFQDFDHRTYRMQARG